MREPEKTIRVVLTGGGAAGHVVPNLALITGLRPAGCSIFYIASRSGIENQILQTTGVPIFRIHTGKLRRYFSIKNLIDIFLASAGIIEAAFILRKTRPHVVFSKGGYVSLPVVIAAWMRRIPIVIHESDVTLGLANRISAKFAHTVCATHEATKSRLPNGKNVIVTGLPLREQIFCGNKKWGLDLCGFDSKKPVLLVLGGGLGSKNLNGVIENCLLELLKTFQVAHITGKGKGLPLNMPGYQQFEFLNEIEHLYACADIIIGRAGATTVAEIIALNKRNILIPLPATVSRGDQLENASLRELQGLSFLIRDEELTPQRLCALVQQMIANGNRHLQPHTALAEPASVQLIRIIVNAAARQKN